MKWMLTCKQASIVISKSLDSPLSRSDRIKLRFHLMICNACNRFNRQLIWLRSVVKQVVNEAENDQTVQLSPEVKIRISQQIKTALEKNIH